MHVSRRGKWMLLVVALLVGSATVQVWYAQPSARSAKVPYSNIYRSDYVGPDACRDCHSEKYDHWSTHPHSKMNLNATEKTVLGDFSGQRISYAGGHVEFEKRDGQFTMSLFFKDLPVRRYRVTRTVGSRFVQMYIGVQTEGPEPDSHPAYRVEGKLPFGYWLSRKSWFPEVYFDSDCPAEYTRSGQLTRPLKHPQQRTIWGQNCIYCHNTYPYQQRLFVGKGSPGFPAADVRLQQTAEQIRASTDAFPQPSDLPKKTLFLHPDQLVTLGISCESCHFGGREHVEEKRPIRYVPCGSKLSFPRATPEFIRNARDNPYVINSICAQCHFADVSKYPNGAGTWNAREAIDLISGACGGQVKCTDCHDPHRPGPPGGGPDAPAHIATCLNCHKQFQDAGARAKHTQHPTSSRVTCLDCHMPRMVQGLEAVIRTHKISSPTEVKMLREGAPNACNLCHLDRSIRWTVAALETGWGRKLIPKPEWRPAYQGNLDGPVGKAWLKHRVPIVRLVAADAYARSPLGKSALPELLQTLNDSRAVNRMFGLFAVERVLGRRLSNEEYAPLASPDVRLKQVKALRSSIP